MSSRFTGNGAEWDGYLGLPFLFIIIFSIKRWYKDKKVRFMTYMAIIFAILSMGPQLHIDGHISGIPLPGILLARLPLLDSMLPCRLMMYAFLFTGIIIAIFINNMSQQKNKKKYIAYSIVALGLIFCIPTLPYQNQKVSVPLFFSSSEIQSYIPKDSEVFIAPVECDLLWQTASDMWFRMPEGYSYSSSNNEHPLYLTVEKIENNENVSLADPVLRAGINGDLTYDNISTVIVGPTDSNENGLITFFKTILGSNPINIWRY